jgi:hypothetical protein
MGLTPAVYQDDPWVYANGRIQVFDLWTDQPPLCRQNIITNEIEHVFGAYFALHESEAWLKMSGWEKTTAVSNGRKI